MSSSGDAAAAENGAVIEWLASHAATYESEHFKPRAQDVGLAPDSLSTASPTEFLKLWFRHYGFNRAGGARAGYPQIGVELLENGEGRLDAPDQLWDAFVARCDERGVGVNRHTNHGVVVETAELVRDHGNLFAWVAETVEETGRLEPAYEDISSISGVGEKIARFFIRDAVWVTDTEAAVPKEDHPYLQPMDVWTRRVAHVLWEDLWSASDAELSEACAEACDRAGVSNAAWNQGAWFYGAKVCDGDPEVFVRNLTREMDG